MTFQVAVINILKSMYKEPVQVRSYILTHHAYICLQEKKKNPTQTGLNKKGIYWLT